MQILVMCEDGKTFVNLDSKELAKSAIDNDVNLAGFIETCKQFKATSPSDIEDIRKWQTEAFRYYLGLDPVDGPTESNK